MSTLTPMMKQYLEIKKKYQNEILFFRMGDFYEMFFEDANVASKVLDIALTSRQNDIPMCGIPYHAAESYIARLIKAGFRVAICEQMEAVPSSGSIVKREVVRIITPGTVIESNLLPSDDNNFLASIIIAEKTIGMAFIDISTGDFYLSSIEKQLDLFRGELLRFNPREVVLKESTDPEDIFSNHIKNSQLPVYRINEWYYDVDYMIDVIRTVFNLSNIKGLGISSDTELMAAGAILQYLTDTHKKAFDHLKYPQRILSSDYMILDDATITSLELVQNPSDGSKARTLFSVLNHTKTAMGRRTLERAILQPLLMKDEIEKRLDIVQYFFEYQELTRKVQDMLNGIYDLERLISRFTLGRSFPRDYLSLMQSLNASLDIRRVLSEQPYELFVDMSKSIPSLKALSERIQKTIADDPALTPEHGRIIREGFHSDLDRLYHLKKDAKGWILNYQEEEKKRLHIPTLKVKYNKVLGYYIEVSKSHVAKIPENYFRKQTLVGSERYTTEVLQKFESDILSASDEITEIEKEELRKLHEEILRNRDKLQQTATAVGEIDFFCSLASASTENRFIRPRFADSNTTIIKEGRHPVVEKYYTEEVFIPNDIYLDENDNLILIITGPNMSGKSTYIRMAAIIQLMAQIGCFVPAAEAEMSIVDRIFTRIGASDNIARGESTFLVEMNETAVILNNATGKSLIIMDEVGRGTSTYDGLSIAWAVVEYILRYIRARTLFATHYHELTDLEKRRGISNLNVLVKEHLSGVDFLHKVVPGAADKSYGIHVAQLAGIPKEITNKASRILERLERNVQRKPTPPRSEEESYEQLEIFNAANHRAIQAIRNINLDSLTPLEALNELSRLKKIIE